MNVEFLNYRTMPEDIHLVRKLLPLLCFRSREAETQGEGLCGHEALPGSEQAAADPTLAGAAPSWGLWPYPLA